MKRVFVIKEKVRAAVSITGLCCCTDGISAGIVPPPTHCFYRPLFIRTGHASRRYLRIYNLWFR